MPAAPLRPFPLAEIDSFPARYAGDSAPRVLMFMERNNIQRSAYESTTEHEARLASLAEREILPGKYMSSDFVFLGNRSGPLIIDYDPDKSKFVDKYGSNAITRLDYNRTRGAYFISEREVSRNSYLAQNSFGAQASVSNIFLEGIAIAVKGRLTGDFCERYGSTASSVNIEPSRARLIHSKIREALVATLIPPYISRTSYIGERPTIRTPYLVRAEYKLLVTRPQGFVYFDQDSGEIVMRTRVNRLC